MAGALFLRDDGSPAGFAQRFNHRVGGKEGIAVAGSGIGGVGVSRRRDGHETIPAQFIGAAAPHHVGGVLQLVGHGLAGLWLRPALAVDGFSKLLNSTAITYHSCYGMLRGKTNFLIENESTNVCTGDDATRPVRANRARPPPPASPALTLPPPLPERISSDGESGDRTDKNHASDLPPNGQTHIACGR
jgi:hypothetical protein